MKKEKRDRGKRSKLKIQKFIVRLGLVCLLLMSLLAAFVIYRDYTERPGLLETDSLKAVERGTDHITLEWDEVRNTEKFSLFYKLRGREHKDWTKLSIDVDELMVSSSEGNENTKNEKDRIKLSTDVTGLEEGSTYVFVIRPDNGKREGFETGGVAFSTRKTQKIKVKKKYTKLTCSKAFWLDAKAETGLSYASSDKKIAKVNKRNGKVTLTGPGTVTIKIKASQNKEYASDSAEVKIKVIETEPVDAGGASAHIIYHLDSSNCEPIKAVTGAGGAVVPQAFGYTGDKYIIAYGMSGRQRIVSFDVEGDGKSVSVPSVALGHPNGFCYSDSTKLCYCVKGWTGRCVTYSPETGAYGVITLPVGCSGIAYDRKENKFYTSSRTAMVSFSGDGRFTRVRNVGVVKHAGTRYTQDCGGHAGIMMRCLSGAVKHSVNYVDLYDMKQGKYLGTLSCDLSEVESAVCDDEGYMLLLCNNTSGTDYIWKTDINIEDIGDGLM